MQLSETINVYPINLSIGDSVETKVLQLKDPRRPDIFELCVDPTTAAELLTILEHFIKTGELPE